ncbi:hypothetical protein Tco_0890275 [Tanacetum coccineum]|uniref:Uncharacterized protein n=1 Tax=Tanacetum coccineum TaxID=301880 RepID=A0ABQ5C2R6_9ASTR
MLGFMSSSEFLENIGKRSGRRLKMKAPKRSKRQKTDSDHGEENQLRIFLKIVPEEEEKIDYKILGTRMDLIELHSLVMKRFETTPPEGIDLLFWGDLRTIVHVLRLEDGTEINMLAERRYPLTKHTLKRMMDLRLTAVSDDDTVFDLLSEELAIPEQTATGKGISNPLMVGSMPKTTKPT